MNKVIHRTKGTLLGLTLGLVAGAPVLADDTELLLVTPPDGVGAKPNVVFILDTSGSMGSTLIAGEAFDPKKDYSAFGSCDFGLLYYQSDIGLPECDAVGVSSIKKESWNCADASNDFANLGSYTGYLSQYRSVDDAKAWHELEPGNSSDDVECENDAGRHGNNTLETTTATYAARGTDVAPWTSDPTEEQDWTSSVKYTVHDGNYLNYLKDPATRYITRLQLMQEETKKVLSSASSMNVGLMRLDDMDGGILIQAPVDLDANRAAIFDRIDGLNADGASPLSETLFESALFWQGLPAYYGDGRSQYVTDPDGLVHTSPAIYKQPELQACSKNFNILVSDGLPSSDTDTPELLNQLPNYSEILGRSDCTGGTGDGACLDDIGEYLSKTDIDATLDGRQSVITHTIGFTLDIPILEETARVSGGQYFYSNETDSLLSALTNIVSQINEQSLSFAAPAIAVNTFNRTRNLNNMYLTMFGARGAAHWPGNLKAYRISGGKIVDSTGAEAVNPATGLFYSSARSYWTEGENQLPDPSVRRLFTDNGSDKNLAGASNAISTLNINMYTKSDFGISGTGPEVEEMIRWMLGEDVKDVDGDPSTTVRYAMGDPLHSQPAAIVYGGTEQTPDTVIFTATNDGYLHAVDASTGKELWSYVPKDLLPRMALLYNNPAMKYKSYGIDGDIVPIIRDVDNDGIIEAGGDDGDFVYILFGMRRGGVTYRMLDVTDKNNPKLIWSRVLDDPGQSWSAPVVTRMDIDEASQNELKAVAVIGGGYDVVHDTAAYNTKPDAVGAGVHVLDLMTGDTLWRAGSETSEADLKLEKMTRAIPTRIKVLDISGDGFADRMYAADLGGQIWRFDISNGQPVASLVAGGVIAQLGAEGLAKPGAADTRRFYNSPDIALFNDTRQNRRFISISIGSGYRAHPLDLDATDRFYSLRDPNVFNSLSQTQYDNFEPYEEADLIDVSGEVNVTLTSADKGWMLTLPSNQMVLTDAVTFNNEVFFVSFSPDSAGAEACNIGFGTNYLWRVSIINGDPIVDDLGNIEAGGEDAARRSELAQSGIAPTPQFLFPGPDDADCTGAECNPPPIGCIGAECFDPGFQNNPVRTLWTQDGIE
jgi:type IV pilus assembly protein PilY1